MRRNILRGRIFSFKIWILVLLTLILSGNVFSNGTRFNEGKFKKYKIENLKKASANASNIYINEFLASNANVNTDEFGDLDDWIEIYNANAFPVNIGGYYITDNLANPTLFQIPTSDASKTTIPANGFLLIWADGEPAEGILHITPKLGAGGEQIGLYRTVNAILEVVDTLTFGAQTTNISFGRSPNGSSNFESYNTPTPGSGNIANPPINTLSQPIFSQNAGFYSTSFNLSLSSNDASVEIRYTTDGSEPTATSKLYTGPIVINDRTSAPNGISMVRTTIPIPEPQTDPTNAWFAPGQVYKGTVVRAKAFKSGSTPSKISTQTFFVDPQLASKYKYPVISLATDSVNLFSNATGIYVPGDGYNGTDWTTSNYFQEGDAWERRVHVEFFETNGSMTLSQDAGVRIHGTGSTRYRVKSLRLYSKPSYGDDYFDYKIFPDNDMIKFKRIVLRNSGQDFNGGHIKDAMVQRTVSPLNTITQTYRPSIVFINGEYWGIHDLRERVDEFYYGTHYNINPDSIDVLEGNHVVSEGSDAHFVNMLNFMKTHNLADNANYEIVKTMMDVDNFIEYWVANVIANNTDWPFNNQKFWRKQTTSYMPNAPYGHDGRWRWTIYDLDNSFVNASNNNLLRTTTEPASAKWSSEVVRLLLTNQQFKTDFINRCADQLNTAFKSDRVNQIITQMQNELSPEISGHIVRWKAPASISSWNNAVQINRDFANQRPATMYSHVLSRFSLAGTANVTLNVSDVNAGNIKISTVLVNENTPGVSGNPYPWVGKYFKGNPVRIEAIAKPGYKFVSWSNSSLPVNPVLTVTLTQDASYTAIFEPSTPVVIRPTPFDLATGNYSFTQWLETSTAGTYPSNMLFVRAADAVLDPSLGEAMTQDYTGVYNATSQTRINGLGTNGFSFINTSTLGNLGAAVLALKTKGRSNINLVFTAGTVLANVRVYAMRLQYKIGDNNWLDVPGPVEYMKDTTGHSQTFNINLSNLTNSAVNDKDVVFLRWKYYFVSGTTGARPQLRLDDITVSSSAATPTISANAGADKTLFFPQNSISLPGSGTSSATITSYQWIQVNGPSTATLTNGNTATATASNLQKGSYTFKLTVNNNIGGSAFDEVIVNVVPQAVISLTLINADNDIDIKTLQNNETINLANLPSKNLNIRANTNPSLVGSVVFVSGSTTKKESTAPYSFMGDNNGNYNAWTPAPGNYTITATPFSGSGGGGTQGTPLTINFTIVNQVSNQLPIVNAGTDKTITLPLNSLNITSTASDPDGSITSYLWTKTSGGSVTMSNTNTATLSLTNLLQGVYLFKITVTDNGNATASDEVLVTVSPASGTGQSVVSFILINADTDTEIKTISNGEQINLASLPTNKLNIKANTNPAKVGSVKFVLNGGTIIESTPPYAVKGDNEGNYNAWTPALGNYSLTATPYTQSNAGGSAGTSLSISFSFVNNLAAAMQLEDLSALSVVDTSEVTEMNAYPNPFTDVINIEFKTNISQYVTLEIYDEDGDLVKVLYEGMVNAGQIYIYQFDGSKASKGIYYSRITTRKLVRSQRLMLIK